MKLLTGRAQQPNRDFNQQISRTNTRFYSNNLKNQKNILPTQSQEPNKKINQENHT